MFIRKISTGLRLRGLIVYHVLVMGLLVWLPACQQQKEDQPGHESNAGQPAALQSVTIPVEGMTCGSCEAYIKEVVGQLPGVSEVRASHEAAQAVITYDPSQQTVAGLVDAINTKTDYKVARPGEATGASGSGPATAPSTAPSGGTSDED